MHVLKSTCTLHTTYSVILVATVGNGCSPPAVSNAIRDCNCPYCLAAGRVGFMFSGRFGVRVVALFAVGAVWYRKEEVG